MTTRKNPKFLPGREMRAVYYYAEILAKKAGKRGVVKPSLALEGMSIALIVLLGEEIPETPRGVREAGYTLALDVLRER